MANEINALTNGITPVTLETLDSFLEKAKIQNPVMFPVREAAGEFKKLRAQLEEEAKVSKPADSTANDVKEEVKVEKEDKLNKPNSKSK